MRVTQIALGLISFLLCAFACGAEPAFTSPAEKKRNNLVAELLHASSISEANAEFTFTRGTQGWIFISVRFRGTGTAKSTLDPASRRDAVIVHDAKDGQRAEAVRFVSKGEHRLRLECAGNLRLDELAVRAIPELIHCGLGFDPAIKSYGRYDLEFLKKDILPNVTTLIVPHNIKLPQTIIDDWHRHGKHFIAEVGIDGQGKTAEDHFKYWTNFLDKSSFLDGVIVNEFIVNNPLTQPGAAVSPERQARVERERQRYRLYQEAIPPPFILASWKRRTREIDL